MDIFKTIPEKINVNHNIKQIRLLIDEKKAIVRIEPDDENHYEVLVDLVPILTMITETQKTTIKTFLKKIISEGVEILETEVPDFF